MKILGVVFNFVLIIAITCACRDNSTGENSLPPIKLQEEEYSDSVKNLNLSLNFPTNDLINKSEKNDFLKVVFNQNTNNLDSLIYFAFNYHKNMATDITILYLDNVVISAKCVTQNWIDGGDTLVTNSYISYLRKNKTKLTLSNIIKSPNEIDLLTGMINRKYHNDIFLSPDVDIAILGDSLSFYYNKSHQKNFSVSLHISDMIDKFEKFKTIYNE